MFLFDDKENSYETAQMDSLIWVFIRQTCQKVNFLMLGLKYLLEVDYW